MTVFYHTFSMSRLSEALIESVSCHRTVLGLYGVVTIQSLRGC